MVIVMSPGATDAQIVTVVSRVTDAGGEAFVSRGDTRTIIGLVGDLDRFHGLNLRALDGVTEVVRISTPFKPKWTPPSLNCSRRKQNWRIRW